MNTYLSNDVLYYLAVNNPIIWPELLITDTNMRSIALRCFYHSNLSILKSFPALSTKIDEKQNTTQNANKLFMKINNNLYNEAERLNWESAINFRKLSFAEKCANYKCLVENILSSTEMHKIETFSIFAKAVAEKLELSIPDGINMIKFWNEHLINHKDLKNITELDLDSRQLKFLPPEIGLLTNLKVLALNDNHLKTLPQELNHLTHLIALNLNSNYFNEIPNVVEKLSNLRHLRMRNNYLTGIDFNFKSLSVLEFLDLSQNNLKYFPLQISDLENLDKLSIDSANLETLPNQLNLKKLKTLSLGNNKLKDIHSDLFPSVPALRSLFLKRNPLKVEIVQMLAEKYRPYTLEIEMDS